LDFLAKVEVEYVTLKGWEKPIGGCRAFYDLPAAVGVPPPIHCLNNINFKFKCRDYINFVQKELSVPIKWIGVGELAFII